MFTLLLGAVQCPHKAWIVLQSFYIFLIVLNPVVKKSSDFKWSPLWRNMWTAPKEVGIKPFLSLVSFINLSGHKWTETQVESSLVKVFQFFLHTYHMCLIAYSCCTGDRSICHKRQHFAKVCEISILYYGEPSNRIIGKIWSFVPTRSTPLPVSWDTQN